MDDLEAGSTLACDSWGVMRRDKITYRVLRDGTYDLIKVYVSI